MDTGTNTADLKVRHASNTYKGGKSPKTSVLSGAIETSLNEKFFDDEVKIDEVFLAKRRIGGNTVNDRKIAGWKEVPIFLDWKSTYRHSEWFKNLGKIRQKLEDEGISGLLITEPESQKDLNHNHAVNTFINSFLVKQNIWKDNNWLFDTQELLELMESKQMIKSHAERIYIDDRYEDEDNISKVKINGSWKKLKYDDKKVTTYEQLVDVWFDYLDLVEKMKVWLIEEYGEEVICIDPQHRWKEAYTNKMLAKFKDLEDSEYSDKAGAILTLTTYQDKLTEDLILPEEFENSHRGPSWFEAMERLKKCLYLTISNLRQKANNQDKDFSYIWVFECHETGYPHVHLAIFGDVARDLHCTYHEPDSNERDRCDLYHRNEAEVWNQNYNYKCQRARTKDILEYKHDLGQNGVATDITVRLNDSAEAVNNLSNYLMKYMRKNFGEIKSEYLDKDLSDKQWGSLVYNSSMWLTGYRTWGTSRDVGAVMKSKDVESKKEFMNLGGELTDEKDIPYEDLLSRAPKEFRKRVERRKLLTQAIKNRNDLWLEAFTG